MIRLNVGRILKKRGWTAYRLAQEADITIPVAYRLANSAATFKRLDLDTLDAIYRALKVQPGDLIERVAERKVRRGE
jgi:DNA-binding Xre family transcriptional regulator